MQRPESSKKKGPAIKYDTSLLGVRNKNKEAQGKDMKFDSTFSSNSLVNFKFLSGYILKDTDLSQIICSRAFILFNPRATRHILNYVFAVFIYVDSFCQFIFLVLPVLSLRVKVILTQ